ncbi:MAG TPA: hypothetical protein VFF45_00840, partial [Bacilli bacterium]|nr:hypothetical protein [Bacilli bacterium]
RTLRTTPDGNMHRYDAGAERLALGPPKLVPRWRRNSRGRLAKSAQVEPSAGNRRERRAAQRLAKIAAKEARRSAA